MSTYRKSYDGDYTKSYQKSLDWQSQNKKDIEEYLKISKKIASQQYNKNPFSNNYIISNNPLGSNATEKVLANGASSTSQRKRKTEKKIPTPTATNNQQNRTEQITEKSTTKAEKKTQVNNKNVVTNNRTQGPTNNFRTNTSSSNPTSYQNNTNNNNKTIIILSNGNYLNGKTKKQISENEAREILRNNGFKSISTFKINWVIVIFALIFVVNIFTSLAILLSAVLFIKLMTAKKVIWTKGRESYSLKASNEEMNLYKRYALISLIIAIISGIKLYF